MAVEEYYYSSLSAEEIEKRLLGAILFNDTQKLTDDEKALARENIGAGRENKGFIILGYFSTIDELIESLDEAPSPGDAYCIGASAPYHIYVYDGYHAVWVDNGALDIGNTMINDNNTNLNSTWSSEKIKMEFEDAAVSTNLLDNWYFCGSGSQNGDGTFPINQRRASSYSVVDEYCVDRWKLMHGTATLGLNGISIGNSASDGWLVSQKVSQASSFVGKKVTATAFLTNAAGNDIHVDLAINDAMTVYSGNSVTGTGVSSVTVVLPASIDDIEIAVYGTSGATVDLVAIKLEESDVQTLVRYTTTGYAFREIPDYRYELFKCQSATADPADTYANRSIDRYSMVRRITSSNYTITGADVGVTLVPSSEIVSEPVVLSLTNIGSMGMPVGTEIGILNDYASTILLQTSDILLAISGTSGSGAYGYYPANQPHSYQISDYYTFVTLKKLSSDILDGDRWILVGNVEVIS